MQRFMGTCFEAGGLRSFYAEDEPANPPIKRIVELIEAGGIYVNNQNCQRPILLSMAATPSIVISLLAEACLPLPSPSVGAESP